MSFKIVNDNKDKKENEIELYIIPEAGSAALSVNGIRIVQIDLEGNVYLFSSDYDEPQFNTALLKNKLKDKIFNR